MGDFFFLFFLCNSSHPLDHLLERSVTAFPLEFLDPTDTSAALKRGKRLSSHTSFFKSGICLGRTLLCIVKSSSLSSTIKTLEPIDQSMRGKKQPTPFRKLLNNSNEPFKVFKVCLVVDLMLVCNMTDQFAGIVQEFYIPTESSGLSFLKTKLCVATTRGFEVVDLEASRTRVRPRSLNSILIRSCARHRPWTPRAC
jgi:hypothetical protein